MCFIDSLHSKIKMSLLSYVLFFSLFYREKEFRVYKMPVVGLNTDVWYWEEYGEKMTDTSKRFVISFTFDYFVKSLFNTLMLI